MSIPTVVFFLQYLFTRMKFKKHNAEKHKLYFLFLDEFTVMRLPYQLQLQYLKLERLKLPLFDKQDSSVNDYRARLKGTKAMANVRKKEAGQAYYLLEL